MAKITNLDLITRPLPHGADLNYFSVIAIALCFTFLRYLIALQYCRIGITCLPRAGRGITYLPRAGEGITWFFLGRRGGHDVPS